MGLYSAHSFTTTDFFPGFSVKASHLNSSLITALLVFEGMCETRGDEIVVPEDSLGEYLILQVSMVGLIAQGTWSNSKDEKNSSSFYFFKHYS